MTAKEAMNVYAERAFYITIANIGKVDAHAPKGHKVVKDAYVPKEVVPLKRSATLRALTHKRIAVTSPLILDTTSSPLIV